MSSIRKQIFSRFSIIAVAAFLLLMAWLVLDLEPRYRESLEEQLVDTSTVLSSLVSVASRGDELHLNVLRQTFDEAASRSVNAQIFQVTKGALDLHVYVTDPHGTLLYDSTGRSDIGTDFSQWRDVALALNGRYGARTSFLTPGRRETMTLYVASPILVQGHLKGVLSVGKPLRGVSKFIWNARVRVTLISCVLLLAVLIATYIVARRISGPIQELIAHTRAVRAGTQEPVPLFDTDELAALSTAIEEMRKKIEGKEYVQRMLEAFSHEMKSPVAAIRSAVEILLDHPPDAERQQFLGTIGEQTERITILLHKLLELSRLENRGSFQLNDEVDVTLVIRELKDRFDSFLTSKTVAIVTDSDVTCIVRGDAVLLATALSNLLQNASDFSPMGSKICVSVKKTGKQIVVSIEDNGVGIPEYALEKVFDRFYSLERPDTKRKSSGLGLAIVREIATLHGGEVHIANRSTGGCVATLTLNGI